MNERERIVKEWEEADREYWWKCIQCELYYNGFCKRYGFYKSLDYITSILEGKDCPFAAFDTWVICPLTDEMVTTDRCDECGRFTACHNWH